jgi:hypothetical protein
METALYLQAYMYDTQSWLFSYLGMKVDSVVFTIPEDYAFFVNQPSTYSNDTCLVNLSSSTNIDVSFYVMKKNYYQQHTIDDKYTTTVIYFLKNIALSSDSTYYISTEQDPFLLVKRKESLHTWMQEIQHFFNTKEHKNIYIIDANLRNEKVAWGRTHEINQKDFLIFIDTSMWKNNSLCHEIIHTYIPHDYNPPQNDSTHYFFSESIVEYLSNYFFYEKQVLPAIFENSIREYYEKEANVTSIFKITNNRRDASTGGGTARTIYTKTPYIIHKFAQMIGGDDYFVELLAMFYQQVHVKKQASLYDMEHFFKSKSVTNKQWNWFIHNL